jgi:hypothetical protein
VLTILVGVNVKDPSVSQYLADFRKSACFDQYVELAKADAKTLANLARFVSHSISAQSQALGTGGPSQALNPATTAMEPKPSTANQRRSLKGLRHDWTLQTCRVARKTG